MRFYNRQHRHYCGIDLHVKTMYVCILDAAGQVLVHRNVKSTPETFLEIVAPYREDLVVAAECMFTWYWLADVCATDGIVFVLGHALAWSPESAARRDRDQVLLRPRDCGRSRTAVRSITSGHPRELRTTLRRGRCVTRGTCW
jgi:hypothetical protein